MELKVLQNEVPYEQYHQTCIDTKALRSSYLKHLMKSPAHLKASLEGEQETKDHFEFGKKIHKLLENPEKFKDTMVVAPEFIGYTKDGRPSAQSKEAREMKAAWYADIPKHITVLTKEEFEDVNGIWENVKSHKFLRSLLLGGVSEQSLWVKDSATDITLACRPDYISKSGYVVDFKTTRNAHPSFFIDQIFSYRGHSPFYALQAAHYANCIREAGIGAGTSFTIVAIESSKPWGIRIYPLDIGMLGVGEQKRAELTRLYAKSLEKDEWPSYDEKAVDIEIPAYVNAQAEDGAYDE